MCARFSANYRNRIWKQEVMIKKTERSEAAQHGSAVTNGGEERTMDELKYIYYLISINDDNVALFQARTPAGLRSSVWGNKLC